MTIPDFSTAPVRAGDIDGLGRLYSESGNPIFRVGETVLAQRNACEFAAYGSWRVFFPRRIFHSLPGRASGTIHVTSDRLLFLRDIDVWKEVKPLLTPLGLATAAEKESRLKRLKGGGARQYCEVVLSDLHLAHVKRRPRFLRMRLVAKDGVRYEVFVHTDGEDPAFFDSVIGAMRQRFQHPGANE